MHNINPQRYQKTYGDAQTKYNKKITRQLDNLYAITKENDEEMFLERSHDPEFIQVEKFLKQ